jgi:hypothetical protein
MSLVEKYKELDIAMNKDDDKKVEKVFQDILKETFEIINKKIEKEENLLTSNEEELMAIRAMFEYMLELWSEGVIDEAKAVGYDMLYLVDDKKLKEMFSMFVIGMLEGLSVDKFFDKYIRTDKIYKDYFFCDFDDEIDELVIKHQAQFKKEFSE